MLAFRPEVLLLNDPGLVELVNLGMARKRGMPDQRHPRKIRLYNNGVQFGTVVQLAFAGVEKRFEAQEHPW